MRPTPYAAQAFRTGSVYKRNPDMIPNNGGIENALSLRLEHLQLRPELEMNFRSLHKEITKAL